MTFVTLTATSQARLAQILATPRGRRVGVLGLGVSGRAMALWWARQGAQVVGLDQRPDLQDAELVQAGVTLRLGATPELADLEALAISPGADPRQPLVQAFLRADKPVLGE